MNEPYSSGRPQQHTKDSSAKTALAPLSSERRFRVLCSHPRGGVSVTKQSDFNFDLEWIDIISTLGIRALQTPLVPGAPPRFPGRECSIFGVTSHTHNSLVSACSCSRQTFGQAEVYFVGLLHRNTPCTLTSIFCLISPPTALTSTLGSFRTLLCHNTDRVI